MVQIIAAWDPTAEDDGEDHREWARTLPRNFKLGTKRNEVELRSVPKQAAYLTMQEFQKLPLRSKSRVSGLRTHWHKLEA